MSNSRNPDPFRMVTINIPKRLLDQLEKEVPFTDNQSLPELIVSKIAYAISRPISERNLTVIAELKPGTSFADVLKQLQMMENVLQVTHISGNLDFTGSVNSTVETVISPSPQPASRTQEIKAMSVDQVEFSVRARAMMQAANIRTIGELSAKTADELMKYRNFGKKAMRECQSKLRELGLEINWTD